MPTPRTALVVPPRDAPRATLMSYLEKVRADAASASVMLTLSRKLPLTRPELDALAKAGRELDEFQDYTLETIEREVQWAEEQEQEQAYRDRRAADVRTAFVDFTEEFERVLRVVAGASDALIGLSGRAPFTQQAQVKSTAITLQDAVGRMGRVLRDLRGDRVASEPSLEEELKAAYEYLKGTKQWAAGLEASGFFERLSAAGLKPVGDVIDECDRAARTARIKIDDTLRSLARRAPKGRTAAGKTVKVYEVLYDVGHAGPAADGTEIYRTRNPKDAKAWAATHTCYGRDCTVQEADAPLNLARRWGLI